MNAEEPIPTRLRASSEGLGHASHPDIEKRAMDIALTEGRDQATDADFARADEELAGGTTAHASPEADASMEQVTTWDEPLEESGHRVEVIPPENDDNLGEQLVEQGLEEADHDTRVAGVRQRLDDNSTHRVSKLAD